MQAGIGMMSPVGGVNWNHSIINGPFIIHLFRRHGNELSTANPSLNTDLANPTANSASFSW